MIPRSAERIAEARKRGKKPSDMVIVSMVGLLDELNPQIIVTATKEYEWWFLRGLSVVVFTKNDINWRPMVEAIAKARPQHLWIWDVENLEGADVYYFPKVETIDRDPSSWVWKLDFLPWTDYQNREFNK